MRKEKKKAKVIISAVILLSVTLLAVKVFMSLRNSFFRIVERPIFVLTTGSLDVFVFSFQGKEGLFLNCKPIEGAINGLTKVISDDRFKLIILTSAASKYAFSEKLKWMKNYFGSGILPHVFASSSSKSKNMLSDCYDVIIDDSGHVMKSLKDSDVVKILFDRPHNKELPEDLYDYRVYSWPEIIDKLEKIWTGKKIPQSMT